MSTSSISSSIPPPAPLKLGSDVAADWERFRSEWQNYEIATDLESANGKKRATVLLACIGSAAHSVFRSFKFQNADDRSDISKIIEAFDRYCIGETNITYERYVFNQRVQQAGESIEDYVADLRKLAKTCQFEQLEDSLVRDRIVVGIRDETTRRRLLQQKKLTLADAIDVCKASEATSRRLRTTTGADEVDALNKTITTSSRGRRSASKGRGHPGRAPSASRRCAYCDRQHGGQKESCPAYGQTCRSCNKANHFAKVCKSKPTIQRQVCDLQNEELLTLGNGDKVRAYCHLNVNGKSVHFMLDCGATVNVLPLVDASTVNANLTAMRPAAARLTMFDGTELKTLGMLTAMVEHPLTGKRKRMDFYVAATHDRAILGMNACRDMDLLFVNESNICSVQNGRPVASNVVVDSDVIADSDAKPTHAGPKRKSKQRGPGATTPSSVPPPPLDATRSTAAAAAAADARPLTKEVIIERYACLFTGVGRLEGDVHLEIDQTAKPVQMAPRRLPIPIKDEVKRELDEMCKNGIIEPVTHASPWVSALLVVHKPNDKLRICIDPKYLNAALKRSVYMMPTIEDILPQLSKAKVFSTADATHGFNHLCLDDESAELTTFETPFGRYRWKRLCFGISPAPEIFQARMHQLLEGLSGVACIADDILVYGCGDTVEEALVDHDSNMIALLNRCRERDLHLNKDKLQVNRETTTFMGHELTRDGLRPDRRKIKAIADMPPPTDRPALMRLLGLATYLAKFVPNFSQVTAKLRELLVKDVEYRWDDVIHGAALRQLKDMLVTSPVLQYYDVKKPTVIQSDASSFGLGCAILQDGKPVEYASRSSFSIYAQIEKEMLSIYYAMDRFHSYVYGRAVTIETDHKPLIAIVKKPLTSAPKRLQRMLLRMQKYDFTLVYKPGSQMLIADALSRAPLSDQTPTDFKEDLAALADEEQQQALRMVASKATIDLIKRAAATDDQYELLRRQIAIGWPDNAAELPAALREFTTFSDELVEVDGLVFKGQRVVIPADARPEILRRIHSSHIGVNGCIRRAREAVFYPGMTADIKKVVASCAICAAYQASTQKEPLMPHDAPSRPWEKVGVDICTIRQQDYLITVDYLSGYIECDRLPSKRVSDVIYCLKVQFARHGLPIQVCWDNNPFNAVEFRRFAEKYDFQHITSSPHYPQANGRAEAAVKTIKKLFEKATEDREDPHLSLLAFRNTPTAQLGMSPAQVMFGRRTRTHLPTTNQLLSSAHDTAAHDALVAGKRRQADYYNRGPRERSPVSVGDVVRTRWNSKDEWEKAEVTKVLPHRSYLLRYEDGTTRRRTSGHVRFSHEPPLIIRDDNDPAPATANSLLPPTTRPHVEDTTPRPPPTPSSIAPRRHQQSRRIHHDSRGQGGRSNALQS